MYRIASIIIALLFANLSSSLLGQESFSLGTAPTKARSRRAASVGITQNFTNRYKNIFFRETKRQDGVIIHFDDLAENGTLVEIKLDQTIYGNFSISVKRDGPWLVFYHPEPLPVYEIFKVIPRTPNGRLLPAIYPKQIPILCKSPEHAKQAFEYTKYLLQNMKKLPYTDKS